MKLDGFKKKLQDIQWFNILRVKYIKKWFKILNFSCITLYTCITLNTIASNFQSNFYGASKSDISKTAFFSIFSHFMIEIEHDLSTPR